MKWLLALVLVASSTLLGWSVRGVLPSDDPAYIYPRIQEYGPVVRFPEAVAQPRPGSKIAIDLTAGGDAQQLNPAVEKLARFVNIYAGAGKQAAEVQITVVLHGKATPVCLSDAAYAARFDGAANPNLDLMRKLREAGVQFVVCGQSATANQIQPQEIAPEVSLAVSALTANVNLQADGYAFIPMH